jgi:pimeloyl-ACP methyl ester carboxylesterase
LGDEWKQAIIKGMINRDFCYKNFQLHYRQYGSGGNVWLNFHGFGQTHVAFHPIAEVLSKKNTVYSFDIFFHGESYYSKNKPIEKDDWAETISRFLLANDIKKFSLTGFSIGCRLLIPIIEAFPDRIERVVFLAPEGIGTNFWYWLATKPFLRKILKYSIFKPGLFLKTSDFFKRISITDKSLIRFAKSQMRERKQRWRVYKTWVFFRKLKVKREALAGILNEKNIPVIIFLGNQDNIIGKKPLQPFIDKLKDCTLINLDTTHHNLIEHSAEVIGEYLDMK